MNTNAFGMPTGEEIGQADPSMSIDDWLAGAALPRRTVTVYLDGPMLAAYEDLVAEAEQVRGVAPEPSDAAGSDASVGDVSYDAALADLAARLQSCLDRLKKSERTVTVTALTPDQEADAAKKHPEPGEGRMYERVAMSVVAPQYTPTEWERVRNTIGDAQFGRVINAMQAVSVSGVVAPDFSLPASVTQRTGQSSTS